MRMTDCARSEIVFAKQGVPLFNVERSQFLEGFVTEVRRDLVGQQLPIAFGCSGGDRA